MAKNNTLLALAVVGIGAYYWLNNTTTGNVVKNTASVIVDPFGSFVAQEKNWFNTWTFGIFK
jgi:hypothetical protein